MRGKRGLLTLLVAAPGLAVLASTGVSVAGEDGGSGFQSMALNATAGGLQISADKLAGQPPGSAATGVPLASGQLNSSSAHGLASIAWPGTLAANAGSLLLLLGPNPCVPGDDPVAHQPIPVVGGTCDEAAPIPQQVMDNYHYLNEPVRAEAFYPSLAQASQSVPGVQMTAAASADSVSAQAQVGGGATTDGLSFGTVTSNVDVKATGVTAAVTKATSTAHHIDIAGGLVTIDSVASSAVTTTTGSTSTAAGGTTISGMVVAGVPMVVDGHGIHAAGTGVSTDPATAAVQQAMAAAGMRMYATTPTRQVSSGSASFHAGSLVIVWDVDGTGPKDDVVIVLGGADSSSSATLPYPFTPFVPGAFGTPGQVTQPGTATAPSALGPVGGSVPGLVSGSPSQPTLPGTFGLVPVRFGAPLGAAWVVLVLAAAALLALVGGRLPDQLMKPILAGRCVEGVVRRAQQ